MGVLDAGQVDSSLAYYLTRKWWWDYLGRLPDLPTLQSWHDKIVTEGVPNAFGAFLGMPEVGQRRSASGPSI